MNESDVQTGQQLGLYSCRTCGRVSERTGPLVDGATPHCPRCGTALHHRVPGSIERAWAYTIAALVLYVPANALPVMTTASITTGSETHTILGGIHELWIARDWLLAVIVFVASVAVPIVKLVSMLMLLVTARRRSGWCSHERTALYRGLQAVGHWSMLDVFVVVLLVGMIHFAPLAGVEPESGLLAFGAVVVLTILAVESLDPRLLWPDPADNPPPTPLSSPPHE